MSGILKTIKCSFFLSALFLSGCLSFEKESYKNPNKKQVLYPYPEKTPSREIAYLKNISLMDESNLQFISKQMKNVIKKYKKIKQQIAVMEFKVDQILKQQKLLAKQTQTTEDFIEEDFEEEPDTEQAEENEERQNKESLPINENNSKEEEDLTPEEEPILWEEDEVTEETPLFPEEDKKKSGSTAQKRAKDKQQSKLKPPVQLTKAKKLFKRKSYENAISEFQKYRDLHPKGEYYPEATFYIGESFKSLKMPIEAEIFFKEVVETHPQSLWASKAKKNLQE